MIDSATFVKNLLTKRLDQVFPEYPSNSDYLVKDIRGLTLYLIKILEDPQTFDPIKIEKIFDGISYLWIIAEKQPEEWKKNNNFGGVYTEWKKLRKEIVTNRLISPKNYEFFLNYKAKEYKQCFDESFCDIFPRTPIRYTRFIFKLLFGVAFYSTIFLLTAKSFIGWMVCCAILGTITILWLYENRVIANEFNREQQAENSLVRQRGLFPPTSSDTFTQEVAETPLTRDHVSVDDSTLEYADVSTSRYTTLITAV